MLLEWYETSAFEFHAEGALALLCVASCEQHSDYLPVGTDGFLGERVSHGAAQRASAPVYCLPVQRVGFSPHHRAFPGYLTLSQETMLHYLEEICLCVYQNGFDKLLLVNSHGGNQSCLQALANLLGEKYGKSAVVVRYWDLIAAQIDEIRETQSGGMGHAGELETSMMLHYYPQLVDASKFGERPLATGNAWHHPDMFAKNKVYIYKPFEEYSKTGNVGQPQYASAEKGKRIAEAAEEELAKLIDFYAQNDF